MTAEGLLERLEGVRQTSACTWRARCPSHGSRGPSLAIRETDDGRALVHCHAGCTIEEILGAVGLEMHDLFPPRPVENGKPIRRPFPAGDLLAAASEDAFFVAVCAVDVAKGRPVRPEVRQALLAAAARLDAARRCALGR